MFFYCSCGVCGWMRHGRGACSQQLWQRAFPAPATAHLSLSQAPKLLLVPPPYPPLQCHSARQCSLTRWPWGGLRRHCKHSLRHVRSRGRCICDRAETHEAEVSGRERSGQPDRTPSSAPFTWAWPRAATPRRCAGSAPPHPTLTECHPMMCACAQLPHPADQVTRRGVRQWMHFQAEPVHRRLE